MGRLKKRARSIKRSGRKKTKTAKKNIEISVNTDTGGGPAELISK